MTVIAKLMSLQGRRALVTGAAGGIGRVICATLAELGADLVLVDAPGVDCASVVASLQTASGVEAQGVSCDLESSQQRASLIDSVRSEGRLDVLINNAAFVGTSGLDGWATELAGQSVETWRRALEVNLTAAFDLSKGFAELLGRSPGGSIVNVASIYGAYAPDYSLYAGTAMGNPAAYAASKGGLLQLTRWLATTLAPNVRVNAVSPGGVKRGQPAAFVERYEQRTPLKRMATEDDFRGAVAFLATDMSRYVTGHNLPVDGGWGVW